MKRHTRSLISKKQFSDPIRSVERDRGREQTFPFANILGKDGFVKVPQRKPRVVATYLPVERRIAINEKSTAIRN